MGSGLQADIKQKRPFASLHEELYLNVARTAARLELSFAQGIKPYGITPTQYNVLRILRGAQPDGLCRNEIGARLVRSVPDVTRLLDRMEEMGLLGRERAGDDRRYVTTRISRKGLELLDRLDRVIGELHHAQLGHLDKRQMTSLIDLLTEAREGAAR
jgi:DNA-binding MarR family transcriptional regulator